MRVVYYGIDMGVLETYAFDWEPVYDPTGSDYLYTRVLLVVRCIVNGQAEVLNATEGVPFNGPPISYAFEDLVVPPPKTKKQTVPARGPLSGTRFSQDNSVITNGITIGGQAIPAPVPVAIPAIKLPKGPAPATPGVPDSAAIRILTPPRRITNVAIPGANVRDMNISPTMGISARQPGTPMPELRKIVRVPNMPALTHQAIRHRLSVPQQRLYVFAGPGQEIGKPKPGTNDEVVPPAQVILQSPQDSRSQTDCKNGPRPKMLGVHTALGDTNTMLVDWQIETFVNEAKLNRTSLVGALLSNRFSQTQAVKGDGYSVIGTAGTALFRTDFVYDGESPDFKRPVLFMPIPQGFTRTIEYVTGRPDCVGVDYAYTDEQVSSNFVAGVYVNAASISAVHRQAIVGSGGVLTGALTTYERVLNLMALKNWSKPHPEEPKRRKDEPGPARPRRAMPPDVHPGPMAPRPRR